MGDPTTTVEPTNSQQGRTLFQMGCPTVPVIRGSEVRFSLRQPTEVTSLLDWPLSYVSCGEVTPDQPRLQWGVHTEGARSDSFSGLRLGSVDNNITYGLRSTDVTSNSRIASVENQRLGVLSATIGGRVRFKYWNDHAFWWFPLTDGGDKGDTAGVQFGYNLGAHDLRLGDWKFEEVNLTMRLASGNPDRNSAVPMGDGEVYTTVEFPEIDRGDIDLSTTLTNSKNYRLEVGFTLNSGVVRHTIQSDLVHSNLGIPEFPETNHLGGTLYLRLTEW